MPKKPVKPKKGRPAVAEKKVSKTLAIKPSEHAKVVEQYGSLTRAYEKEIQPKLHKPTTLPKGATKK